MKAKTFRIVTFSVVGVLLAIVLALNIAGVIWGPTLIRLLSGKAISAATRGEGEALAEQIVQDGTVLVENRDNVLPLDPYQEKEINVFGWSATQWIATGSGSGNATGNGAKIGTDFLSALDQAEIEYNTDLIDFYMSCGQRNKYAYNTLHGNDYESCSLIEPKIQDYGDVLLSSIDFSLPAVVVLSRVSGESTDAPLVQYKGKGDSSTPSDTTRTYLDASEEELELLQYVGERSEKVIVIINSTNQMNLNFLDSLKDQATEKPLIDACLVAGGTGDNAVTGLVNVLYGQVMYSSPKQGAFGDPVSPSGKLTDTYAYDFRSNPAFANTGFYGVGKYENAGNAYPIDEKNGNFDSGPFTTYTNVSYLDYQESVYVGYKWYETADKEEYFKEVDNEYGKGYEGVVQYPFGYGKSYTDFRWSVSEAPTVSTINLSNVHDEITVKVLVKNTGTFPAKEVVQLYYTPPYYTESGIEKSEVNLLDFAKTQVAVGEGEEIELTLTFKPEDMGSYDYKGNKVEGGGWILEAGDYTISLRTDAHTVATTYDDTFEEETPAEATFTLHVAEDLERYDEQNASNLFTGSSAVDYGISVDGTNTGVSENSYLTRATKFANFPTPPQGVPTTWLKSRTMDQKLKDTNLYTAQQAQAWATEQDEKAVANGSPAGVEMPVMGKNNNLQLFNGTLPDPVYGVLLGESYDNETWEDVLDQLTADELKNLALHGYIHEETLKSIGKAETTSLDGPSQYASYNVSNPCVGYPNPSMLGQTWDVELAKSFGLAVANEARERAEHDGVKDAVGWYAPGLNLHRSAFGGRNYEYYSEDSYLSGMMGAKVVEGSLDMGVYVYIKHIIGYDQETMRDGLYCWMTEQALREIYMRPFTLALTELKENVNGTAGLMTSYGRIGAVWSGGSEALITSFLREEWGYRGAILTDYADHHNFMNGDQMVRAGGDIWMDGAEGDGAFQAGFDTSSAAFMSRLRDGAHHVLYMMCNAAYVSSNYNAANDLPPVTSVNGGGGKFPLWTIIGVVDGVVIAGCAVWVVFAILKKDKSPAPAGDGTTESPDATVTESEPTATETEPPTTEPLATEPPAAETGAQETAEQPSDGGGKE